ncbi:dihydrofolate synthase / folylpolyglutamate synthase [uncultured bacterium]|nr:dihydrofolate synthase / folylpolyglutamate synthase [uncultured bacterium]
MPSSKGIVEYLYGLERHGIKPGLERITALLRALGGPQDSFKSVHVAGTNGKGSVSSMTASVLNEAGYRTGLYTSPHLSKFNERISVSGKNISDKELVEAASEVKAALKRSRISGVTFFEFTTAMAFLHFRKKKVEFAVVETGMGGRLDATNLVTPLVSVITNIALDHTEWLGPTLKDVATEKAGIIKPGVPVVTGESARAPLSIIRAAAKKASSKLLVMEKDFHAEGPPSTFSYSGFSGGLEKLKLKLLGSHQVRNAALALAAIELLRSNGITIRESAIKKGLAKAAWPGRFEILSKRPLVVLDGAHNPSGAAALKEALSSLKKKRLILVIGMMSDKDMAGILKELVPICDLVIATRPKGERSAELASIGRAASRYGKPVTGIDSIADACEKALYLASQADCVCVSGSLFTVAEAREYLLKALSGR